MRRLARYLVAAASVASLLLFVATCVLWWRSYERSDRVAWRGEDRWFSVRSAVGYVAIDLSAGFRIGTRGDAPGVTYHRDIPRPPYNNLGELNFDHGDVVFDWHRGAFSWYSYRSGRSGYFMANGAAPFWCVAAATGALPLVRGVWCARRGVAGRRRRRRKRAGLCTRCGYDLRTTPDGSGPRATRCPECGVAAAE